MESTSMQTRNLAFLLSEASGRRSRAQGTIPAGTGKVLAGTIIGQLTGAEGQFVPSPIAEVAGLEGAEVATAILGYNVDATLEDVEVAIIDRDAEAKLPMLLFEASVDDAAKIATKVAQLSAVGIRTR